jgi:hypothetical protein
MNKELKLHYWNIFFESISSKQLKKISRRIALFNYLTNLKTESTKNEIYLNVKKQWRVLSSVNPLLKYSSKRILERDIEALLKGKNIQERKDSYFDETLNKIIPNSKLLTVNSTSNLESVSSVLENHYFSSLINFHKDN